MTSITFAPRFAMSRLASGTAFVGVVLAFTLPFGAVSSCGGEEVRFTGLELAAFDVAPDPSQSGRLHEDVERNGAVLALCVLLAAAVGVALVALGRKGDGVCASLGLVALQLLGFAILLSADGSTQLLDGYWLAFASMAAAGAIRLGIAVRDRRRSGRRAWGWAIGRTALAFLPLLLVLGLLVVAGVVTLFE